MLILHRFKTTSFLNIVLMSLLFSTQSAAQESIRIAVAANFLATLKVISKDFTKQTGIKVSLSNGATGMLYAQIKKGAPYEMFFSADTERPLLLEQQGLIEAGSRFSYVQGKLVVWSPNPQIISADLSKTATNISQLRFFAMANPKIAPYGLAAQKVLEHYGLYKALKQQNKIALGENIGKTYQYVATGNAQLGLLAKSYVSRPGQKLKGEIIELDDALYPPIFQQAVILKNRNRPAVQQFVKFLQSEKIQNLIKQFGYGLVPIEINQTDQTIQDIKTVQ